MKSESKGARLSRKKFLQKGAVLGAGVCAIGLGGCSLFDEPEMKVCAVSALDETPFLITKFNRKKIFVTRLDDEITIFSLICRHKKCTVGYEESEQLFICPCHEGTYDQYGQVIDGPPPGPLHRFKYEIRGTELWVINEFLKTNSSTS